MQPCWPPPRPPLTGRDFLRVDDLSTEEMVAVLDLADELKAMQATRLPHPLLPGARSA